MTSILYFLAPWWLNLTDDRKSRHLVTWLSLSEDHGGIQFSACFGFILNVRGCGSADALNVF